MSKDERPEALAQFAESARVGERAGVKGLTATKATEPIPTDPKAKQDAATRVLAEGATGEDFDAEEAVDAPPDRILGSQEKSKETGTVGEELDQAPGRMASPASSEGASDSSGSRQSEEASQNAEALEALVSMGFSREAAVDLVAEMGLPSSGEPLAEWSARVTGGLPTKESRKQILAEHHEKGLPPLEPPPLGGE